MNPLDRKDAAAQRDCTTSPKSRTHDEALKTSKQAAGAAQMKQGKSDSFEKMLPVVWNSQTILMEQLEMNTLPAPHLLPMGNL